MFHLTRSEQVLIAGLLLAFLTGLAVKHSRSGPLRPETPPPALSDAKR